MSRPACLEHTRRIDLPLPLELRALNPSRDQAARRTRIENWS